MDEMKVNAAPANTDPQTEAPAEMDPLKDFYELANNLIKDRSKDPTLAISIAYGCLNTIARQGKLTPAQMEQVFGSFVISYLNLLS